MKRKVLQLVSSFNQGGSERQAVQLARLLKESDRYDVRMACLDLSGVLLDEARRLEIGEIPEYKLTSFYDRNMVTQLRRFAAFLRRESIDVLHTHDFYTNVFGMMAGAIARVPVRVASRRETTGWRTEKQKFVERLAYRLAHRVVANAEAVRDQLVKEGVSSEKIVTVYNGLDTARIKPMPGLRRDETLASFGLPCGDELQFVTIVANLRHPVKDHPTFLRAAALVRAARPGARFIIAGGRVATTRSSILSLSGFLVPPGRTSASKSPASTSSIVRSTSTLALLVALDLALLQRGERDLGAALSQDPARLEQLAVLIAVGGDHQNLRVGDARHGILLRGPSTARVPAARSGTNRRSGRLQAPCSASSTTRPFPASPASAAAATGNISRPTEAGSPTARRSTG